MNFWRQFPAAIIGDALSAVDAVTGHAGRVMTLPNNAFILGDPRLGSQLYICPSYQTMYGVIIQQLDALHDKGLVVLG